MQQYGAKGIIYLNDIDSYGLELAVEHLRNWLIVNDYSEIQVIGLHGDYNSIELPKVNSAHLSNPDLLQLPRHTSERKNRDIVKRLVEIADGSESGLTIAASYSISQGAAVLKIGDYVSSEQFFEIYSDQGYRYRRATDTLNAIKSEQQSGRDSHRFQLLSPRQVCEAKLTKF